MRLIDADELIEHVWRDKLDSRELIAGMIDNAPTVKDIPTNIPISIFEQLFSQKGMKYAVMLKNNEASIEISEHLTSKELDVVKEMLIKAIDIRKQEIMKTESDELTRDDSIDAIYPPLSARTRNILLRAGYNTIGDVLCSSKSELMKVRHMGKKSFDEIESRFSKYGKFKGEE